MILLNRHAHLATTFVLSAISFIAQATDGLGVSYKNRTYISQLKDYSGLFTGQGSFDIQSSLDTGLSRAVTDNVTTAIDIQQIFYSEVNSVGNPLQPLFSGVKLAAGNGPGFSYKLPNQDELSFAFMYSPQNTISGHNPLAPSQNVSLAMTQYPLTVGSSRRFR